MAQPDERLCYPPPVAELERRWAAARRHMREAAIDALIVQGANSFSGGAGHFRWLSGTPSPTSYPQTLILPASGAATLVHHGDLGGEHANDPANPSQPGIGARLTTASFPTVAYTGTYDADIVAKAVQKGGYRTVGLVGANSAYHGFMARLKETLGAVRVIDATDAIDRLKAVKSDYDIGALRRAAAMQDEIFARVKTHIRPGMKDFEILAYGHYVGQLLGSGEGYFLGSSSPAGQSPMLRLRPQQGREIKKGDVLLFQAENSGPDGFYVHMARAFVLGKAPQTLTDAFAAALEAQRFTVDLLKPGTPCRDIYETYNGWMRSHGFPVERRLHCHGQGYESVERPLARHDETMAIGARMNIGIHPAVTLAGTFMTVCDNFLVGPDGAVERLHKTPQEIIEV